jgi:aliphatic nitrilase
MGINERAPGTLGTLYNTMLFIGRDGEVLGRHRKIMPTFAERLVHAAGDASGLRVYPTAFGEIGGLICGENTNPLAKFALFSQGEKIHVASWPALPAPANHVNREGAGLRTRAAAFEGKVFVLAPAGVFDQRMIDMLCDTEERRGLVVSSGGHSAIVGPNGQYLAGPLMEGEGILVAEMDLEQIIEAKIVHDVTGHYNRPDLFTLTVDRRPRPLARFADPASEADGAGAVDADLLRALLARLAEARDEEIGRALRDLLQRAPTSEA